MKTPDPDIPSAPERAPGGGRELARNDWQDDAWLEKPVDRDRILALADRLEARTGNVIVYRGGRPGNELGPDADCREAAYWLRYFMGEKR